MGLVPPRLQQGYRILARGLFLPPPLVARKRGTETESAPVPLLRRLESKFPEPASNSLIRLLNSLFPRKNSLFFQAQGIGVQAFDLSNRLDAKNAQKGRI